MARAFGLDALGRMDTVEYLRCARHLDRWFGDYRAHQILAQQAFLATDGKKGSPSDFVPWQELEETKTESSPFDVFD